VLVQLGGQLVVGVYVIFQVWVFQKSIQKLKNVNIRLIDFFNLTWKDLDCVVL